MGRPVPFYVGNHTLSATVQTRIIMDTNTRIRCIEVAESRGKRRELLASIIFPELLLRGLGLRVSILGIRILHQGHGLHQHVK